MPIPNIGEYAQHRGCDPSIQPQGTVAPVALGEDDVYDASAAPPPLLALVDDAVVVIDDDDNDACDVNDVVVGLFSLLNTASCARAMSRGRRRR